MQKFKYKGQVVMASTMKQAISKIIASKKAMHKVKADSSDLREFKTEDYKNIM